MNSYPNNLLNEIKKTVKEFNQDYGKMQREHEVSVYIQILSHILINHIKNIFVKNNLERESITFFNKKYSFLYSGTEMIMELFPGVNSDKIENLIREEFDNAFVDIALINRTVEIKKKSVKISKMVDIQKVMDEYLNLSIKLNRFGKRDPKSMIPFATEIANIIAFPLYIAEKINKNICKDLSKELLLYGMMLEDFIFMSKEDNILGSNEKRKKLYHGIFFGNEPFDRSSFESFMNMDSFRHLKHTLFYPLMRQYAYLFVRYYDLMNDFNYLMSRSKVLIEKDIKNEEVLVLNKILDQMIIEKVISKREASSKLKYFGLYSEKEQTVEKKGRELINKQTVGFSELTSEEIKKQFRKALNPIIQKWFNE